MSRSATLLSDYGLQMVLHYFSMRIMNFDGVLQQLCLLLAHRYTRKYLTVV